MKRGPTLTASSPMRFRMLFTKFAKGIAERFADLMGERLIVHAEFRQASHAT